MSGIPKRAQLRLGASTKLPPNDCLDLVRQAVNDAKPGANYAGQGLSLDIAESDETSLSIVMTDRSRGLCAFTAEVRGTDGMTRVRIGGLDDALVLKHSVMFVPVGKEIAGFGYYKRFLAAAEVALRAADPNANITVSVAA